MPRVTNETIDLEVIEAARDRLKSLVAKTPLTRSEHLSELTGTSAYLKLENRQTTGSFKLRGATNAVLCLSSDDRRRGLVTASTGNHGRAVAHAASEQGLIATVCLSSLVPRNKVDAIRNLGADVRIVGKSQDDAMDEVARLAREEGMNVIPRSTIGALLPDRAQSVWKSLMSSRTLRLLSFLFQAEGSLQASPQLLKPVDLIAVSSAFPCLVAQPWMPASKLADRSMSRSWRRLQIHWAAVSGSIIIGLLRCAARYWTKWSCSMKRRSQQESDMPRRGKAKSSKVLRQSALGPY